LNSEVSAGWNSHKSDAACYKEHSQKSPTHEMIITGWLIYNADNVRYVKLVIWTSQRTQAAVFPLIPHHLEGVR
jgi:uncharacterized protein (DUF736 family)